VDAVLEDPGVHQLGVMLATTTGEAAALGAQVMADAITRHAKPVFAFLSVPREVTAGGLDTLEKAGIPVFPSPTRVARAMNVLSSYRRARDTHAARQAAASEGVKTALPANSDTAGASGLLSEHQSKAWLSASGVQVSNDRLVPAAPMDRMQAQSFEYPVALKVVSRDIPHKSEIGGVQLDIEDADELLAKGPPPTPSGPSPTPTKTTPRVCWPP
jgi:acetyltransferase